MAWRIERDDFAKKDFATRDNQPARLIAKSIRQRVMRLVHARQIGDAPKGPEFGDVRRCRVAVYRLIARIEDKVIGVLIVKIGHRSDAFD